MAWSTAISAAAAVAGLAGLSFLPQEPNFDFEMAAPKFAQANFTHTVTEAQSQRVSVTFKGARASEVLDWMQKKEGVSFVVNDADLKGVSITMNVDGQPLENVLDALAAAMGGKWEKKGAVHAFVKGGAWAIFSDGSASPFKGLPDGTWSQGLKELGPNVFNYNSKDWEKNLKEFNNGNQNLPNLKDFYGGNQNLPNFKDLRSGNSQFPNLRDFNSGNQKLDLKGLLQSGQDLEGLVKSLTDKQRELQKTQGYLKYSDLTPAQQKMLGMKDAKGSDFELTYTKNGQTLTIKSK